MQVNRHTSVHNCHPYEDDENDAHVPKTTTSCRDSACFALRYVQSLHIATFYFYLYLYTLSYRVIVKAYYYCYRFPVSGFYSPDESVQLNANSYDTPSVLGAAWGLGHTCSGVGLCCDLNPSGHVVRCRQKLQILGSHKMRRKVTPFQALSRTPLGELTQCSPDSLASGSL